MTNCPSKGHSDCDIPLILNVGAHACIGALLQYNFTTCNVTVPAAFLYTCNNFDVACKIAKVPTCGGHLCQHCAICTLIESV